MKSIAFLAAVSAALSAASVVSVVRAQSPVAAPPGPGAPSPNPSVAASAPAAAAKMTPTIDTKAAAAKVTPAPKAPAATATPAKGPSAAATAPPAVVVITQPAAPAAAPAPAPSNNWGAGVLGLVILGGGGYFGLRYAQQRGMTVAGSLQKLGVEMPQDGVNGPATISHLKPPPPQAAILPPLPSLSNLPEAATVGTGAAAAVSAPAKKPGIGTLIGTLGPVEGKQLTVPADAPLTMGRDTDNTLPLPDDTTVSRRHARIEAVPGASGFQIVDEGSSNGSYVNGQRLTSGQARLLVVGDEIQIGASRLRFEG